MPLVPIVASAAVFYYGWANELVYHAFGEEAPRRGGPPRQQASAPAPTRKSAAEVLPLEQLTARAMEHVPGSWRTVTVSLPEEGQATVRYSIDRGTGGRPQHRYDLELDAATGTVISAERFAGSPGRRARALVRFLHTGEALGIVGQTIAGAVSARTGLAGDRFG